MILAKAILIAGPHHKKYTSGESLPALLFVAAQDDVELEQVASRELSDLGWASMTIERYKDVSDLEQFNGKDTPEAIACRDALQTGFGVVVYPNASGT